VTDTKVKYKKKKTKSVKFAERSPGRPSRYAGLIEAMKGLAEGESLELAAEDGVTPKQAHNRLNSALRNAKPQAPKGCVFRKRTSITGGLVISCVPASEAPAKKKKAPAKKKTAAKKKAPAKKKKAAAKKKAPGKKPKPKPTAKPAHTAAKKKADALARAKARKKAAEKPVEA